MGAEHAALTERHRVVRCDLRGFGASPPPDGPYSHADDLAAARAAWLAMPLFAHSPPDVNAALREFLSRVEAVQRRRGSRQRPAASSQSRIDM